MRDGMQERAGRTDPLAVLDGAGRRSDSLGIVGVHVVGRRPPQLGAGRDEFVAQQGAVDIDRDAERST